MAFFEKAHILCEATKPTIVLTDNKPVTVFFQLMTFPPALWIVCGYVLQFFFKLHNSLGSVNTAAGSLSRLELKVTEKIPLKIREDIRTPPIEVTTPSSDVADENNFPPQKHTVRMSQNNEPLNKENNLDKMRKKCLADEEPHSLKTSVKEFTKIAGNTTSYSMNGIKANARIRLEQDVDLVIRKMKLKIIEQPYDDVLITTDSRYKHYRANEERKIRNDNLLLRKFLGETGSVKHFQTLIPKQLDIELLHSLHGKFGKKPGNYQHKKCLQRNILFHKDAQLISEWVRTCDQCI